MIKTERLNIVPLTYCELNEYITNRMGSIKTADDAMWVTENHLFRMNDRSKLFNTFWLALNSEREVVAEGAFKGEPNEYGEVEIGYYVLEAYRGKGYSTELVNGMLDWAEKQDNVEFVVAAVKPENYISQRTLKKNNFVIWGEKNDHIIFYKKAKN